VLNGLTRVNEQHFSFPRSSAHTFCHRGGNGQSVVDFVCTDSRLLAHVCDVIVCSGAAPLSDHFPVVCYIRNTPQPTPIPQPSISTRKLRWSETMHQHICATLPYNADFLAVDSFFRVAAEGGKPVEASALRDMHSRWDACVWMCATGRPAPDRGRRQRPKPVRENDDDSSAARTQWFDAECAALRHRYTASARRARRSRKLFGTQLGTCSADSTDARSQLREYLMVCRAKRRVWLDSFAAEIDAAYQPACRACTTDSLQRPD
jgi:hypothetical protein